jgi:hypothetical protein
MRPSKRRRPFADFSVTFANGDREVLEIDNYCFTRINKYLKLKKKIREVLDMKDTHNKEFHSTWLNSFTDILAGNFFQTPTTNNEIENYWQSHMGKTDLKEDYKKDSRVYEAVILQRTFRIWIFLARLRKHKKSALLIPKTYAGETQTKEEKDEQELRQRMSQKQIQNKKKLAAKFCRTMVDGKYKNVKVLLLGQAAMSDSPIFRMSKDRTSVETSSGVYELNRIYDVQIGLTTESKKLLRLQDDRCLHLKMTGKVVLEIEAISTEDAGQLFTGFKVLRNCLMSMYSFKIVDGIPRRWISTVIDALIEEGQHLDFDDGKSSNSDPQRKSDDGKHFATRRESTQLKSSADDATLNTVSLDQVNMALQPPTSNKEGVDSDDDSNV